MPLFTINIWNKFQNFGINIPLKFNEVFIQSTSSIFSMIKILIFHHYRIWKEYMECLFAGEMWQNYLSLLCCLKQGTTPTDVSCSSNNWSEGVFELFSYFLHTWQAFFFSVVDTCESLKTTCCQWGVSDKSCPTALGQLQILLLFNINLLV